MLFRSNLLTSESRGPPLKLSTLPEIAALLAAYGQNFVDQASSVSVQVIGDYYVHSRNRFNRWMRVLDRLEASSDPMGAVVDDVTCQSGIDSGISVLRELAEQILVNELPVRVWTLLLVAQDRQRGSSESEALATNVLRGHLTVRRRLLQLCRNLEFSESELALRVEHLRRETEVWFDILCCPFMKRYDLWSLACDEEDARDYFRQRQERCALDHCSAAWVAMLSGLRDSFIDVDSPPVLVAEDDIRLVRLMASCFPENCTEINWLSAGYPLGV